MLILPKWLVSIKLYDESWAFDVQSGSVPEHVGQDDCLVGFSLGALTILDASDRVKGRIILVNPPLPKRNLFVWLMHWYRFFMREGLSSTRQKFTKNPFRFIVALVDCARLLSKDFSPALKALKERVVVVRGKGDDYFCDDVAVDFLKELGVRVVEVDAGHNWSEEAEGVVC